MTLTITATEKLATTNSFRLLVTPSCTNCIYGDYWNDHHAQAQHQTSGFDCCYPNIGSKSPRNIDFEVIDDQSTAAHCPNYQLGDATS
jgi:hypothetical protein